MLRCVVCIMKGYGVLFSEPKVWLMKYDGKVREELFKSRNYSNSIAFYRGVILKEQREDTFNIQTSVNLITE